MSTANRLAKAAAAAFPANAGRTRSARAALEIYRRETGSSGEPAERLLRTLIADLGHLATLEGVAFLPIVAHAEAYWLQQSVSAKERPKTEP
ncbi:MAG: hypothetical protein ACLPPF_20120 [Rhodomicrobium sp.]